MHTNNIRTCKNRSPTGLLGGCKKLQSLFFMVPVCFEPPFMERVTSFVDRVMSFMGRLTSDSLSKESDNS